MTSTETFLDAVKQGDYEVVTSHLVAQPDLANSRTAEGLSAVLLATYYGQPKIARLLIDSGAVLNLFEAAAVGHLDTIQAILTAHPEQVNDYAQDGFFALALAAFFGHTEVVAYLLDHNADVHQAATNAQRVNSLHAASANRHFDICHMLIERGIDVNATQEGGFTPLQAAAQNGQLELVELLLQHGANAAAKNHEGHTALDIARANNHDAVVRRLEGV